MPGSELCQVLSTELHAHCRDKQCDCSCHLKSRSNDGVVKRVHSIPREQWNMMSPTAKFHTWLRSKGVKVIPKGQQSNGR